jgi:hypothetical protein
VKKSLLKAIVGGGLWGGLIADVIFDERPVNLSLPVCGNHGDDARLSSITGTPSGSRRITLANVHPTFVTAVNGFLRRQWADLE